jgi:hypothetical protein
MKNLLQHFLACTALIAAASMASVAKAQLTNSDWLTLGDNQILNDGSTGLQWLGLDETAGLSYNFVASQLGTGDEFAGFRFATESQVDTLFADAGIPDVNAGFEGTSANVPGVTSLLGLWNADIAGSYEADSGPFGYFYTAGVGTGLLWIPGAEYGDPGTAEATSGPDRLSLGGDGDSTSVYLGSALIRDGTTSTIPDEGVTVSMLGGALTLIAALRRRAGKK